MENLYDALETRAFSSEELAPRIRKMQAKRDDLVRTRNQIESTLQSNMLMAPDVHVVQEYVDDLKALLVSSPIVEQRAFLKSFVDNIQVGSDEITINYFLPMPPANTNTEVIGVLPFVTNGRPCRSRTCDTLIKRYKSSVPPSDNQ